MRIGDIDGKGTIYDSLGQPILHPGEKVKDSFKGTAKSWAAEYHRNMREVFLSGTQGVHFEGRFWVTQRRIIFLAEPRRFNASSNVTGMYGGAIGDLQYVINRSNLAVERKGKMYLEFTTSDIESIRVGVASTYIQLIKADGRTIRFVFDSETGRNLENALVSL